MSSDLYNDHERRLDTITGKAQFWPTVASMYRDCEFYNSRDLDAFRDFLLSEYGVEINKTEDGRHWQQEFHIRDEQKYLLFLLKYTK
jgi:hypothetical protein